MYDGLLGTIRHYMMVQLYMTRCEIRVTVAGNEILWSKVLLKFVCLVYNAVQFNPQVISFSTMYNSPYKKLEKIGKFRFFPKKIAKIGKILIS